jgi:hypothetical protein
MPPSHDHDKAEVERPTFAALPRDVVEVADQFRLDAEQSVLIEARVATLEHLRCQRLEIVGADEEVQMCRPAERIADAAKQLADRSVVGHAIAGGLDCAVVEAPLSIRDEDAAQVEFRLQIGLLVLVEPLRIRLPGFDRRTCNRHAVEIGDAS